VWYPTHAQCCVERGLSSVSALYLRTNWSSTFTHLADTQIGVTTAASVSQLVDVLLQLVSLVGGEWTEREQLFTEDLIEPTCLLSRLHMHRQSLEHTQSHTRHRERMPHIEQGRNHAVVHPITLSTESLNAQSWCSSNIKLGSIVNEWWQQQWRYT